MFCNSCGAKNVAESNFCRQCGRKMDKQSAPKISEEAFDRALPEDEQVTALLERAYRRRKENDLPGAIAICNEVLEMRPDSTTAHGMLGQLYEQNGERDKAVEQYERVLKLNPGSIADRVKLDDLREGVVRPDPKKNGRSQVVVVDPNGAPIRSLMIWGVGLCVLLILTGAALAVAFNRHDQGPQANNQSIDRPIKPMPRDDRDPASGNPKEVASLTSPGRSNAQTPTAGGLAQSGFVPQYGFGGPAIQYSGPPVIVYPQPQNNRPAAVPVKNNSIAPSASRSTKPAESAERDASDSDTGSARIRLTVSDGSDAPGDNRVIQVPGAGRDQTGFKPAPNQGPEQQPKIVVRPHAGAVDAGAANAPSAEAAALIAVGNEKLNKMDYNGAIIAYRKALAGANDESAYVYSQMGECYRYNSENKNAIACYERGRDEYRKLITAGRQLERANSGLRICETGIKICGSE